MQEFEWRDRRGSRRRAAWLLLVKGDEVVPFRGEEIPGWVVIRGTDYTKNGDWSFTTYRMVLTPDVRTIHGLDGWETGRFAEGLGAAVGGGTIDTWSDMARALGVSVPSAMSFLRTWRPKAAEALDRVDAALEALEQSAVASDSIDAKMVVVSFGGPTNRAIEAGFWTSPKEIPGGGELRLIDSNIGWDHVDNLAVVDVRGTVISSVHERGYHGGYVKVTVAVIPEPVPEISGEPKMEREPRLATVTIGSFGNPLGEALKKIGE